MSYNLFRNLSLNPLVCVVWLICIFCQMATIQVDNDLDGSSLWWCSLPYWGGNILQRWQLAVSDFLSAVLTTPCNLFLSAAEQRANHTDMLSCCMIKAHQRSLVHAIPPEHPQDVAVVCYKATFSYLYQKCFSEIVVLILLVCWRNCSLFLPT